MYDTFHANIEEKTRRPGDRGRHRTASSTSTSARTTAARPAPATSHWDETFQALRKVGYDGWMVIESFGRALPDLAAATKVWRDLFPTAEEVYTQGMRFMKEKWAATAK